MDCFVGTEYWFTYFDSFGVEHITKEIRTFISNNTKTIIFRIQAYDSIMCGCLCIGYIDFMLAGKTLTKFSNLLSPNNFKKNESELFYDKYLKMAECNSIECNSHETHNTYLNLYDQQQFRLNKINETKDYFVT